MLKSFLYHEVDDDKQDRGLLLSYEMLQTETREF